MERGVSTEEDPLVTGAGMSHRALTGHILALADEAGYRAALIDAASGVVTAWPRFARTVRAAAHGLARRGLAECDTVGVLVQDAASTAIAVNAIRAAGAAACVIRLGASPAEIADRLNACGARLLITSAPLAELASEGADRSRVRQVITFGEAAGTTPFSTLLEAGPPPDAAPSLWPGRAAADPLGRGLTHRDVVIAAPPCGDGQAYTALLDLALLTGATLVAAPLPLVTAALRVYKGTAAMVPRGTSVPGVAPDRLFYVALPQARPGVPPDAAVAGLRWLTYRWPDGTIGNEAEVYSGYYTEAASVLQAYYALTPKAMTRTSDQVPPKPAEQLRADARQNHARLIAAATAAFAEKGADAPLEDIARRAGVGIGTLYRHFPTRTDLQAAVFRSQVGAVCGEGEALLATAPPGQAFSAWMRSLAGYLVTKRGLSHALIEAVGVESELISSCWMAMRQTTERLLANAQEAGLIRRDVDATDVMRLVHGVTVSTEKAPERADTLLSVMLDGLRPPRADQA